VPGPQLERSCALAPSLGMRHPGLPWTCSDQAPSHGSPGEAFQAPAEMGDDLTLDNKLHEQDIDHRASGCISVADRKHMRQDMMAQDKMKEVNTLARTPDEPPSLRCVCHPCLVLSACLCYSILERV
jgi:hypothetical protein